MKVLLFSIVFLFVFACGEYNYERSARLSQGSLPCKEDKDCQSLGAKSKCENEKCVCYDDNKEIECPEPSVDILQSQSAQPRSFEDAEPFIGNKCVNNDDCHYLYAVCNETQQCDCQPDYTGTKDRKYCLKAARNLGDACLKEEQCTLRFPNATCTNKICDCRPNYHKSATQCWKDIGYGEKCDDSRECWHIYGFCPENNHTCVCAGNRVINSQKTLCLDVAQHRERCLETVQCTASLGDADCVQGYCHCARNYHFVPFRQKCIPSKTLGQPCDEDEDCYQTSRNDDRNFLICAHAKVCICSNGFERIGYQCVEIDSESSAITAYASSLLLVTIIGFLLCL